MPLAPVTLEPTSSVPIKMAPVAVIPQLKQPPLGTEKMPSKLPSIQPPTTPTYYRNFPTNATANYKLKSTLKPTGPSKISPTESPSVSKK